MIRLDADRPAHLLRRPHPPRLPPRRGHRPARASRSPSLNRAQGRDGKDNDVNCIMLFLVGGPSQIDTLDPKPKAPAEVRGPFDADRRPTCPACRSARSSPRWPSTPTSSRSSASVYHTATAVHDTGHQMMQTGRLFTGGIEHPHVGCVLGYLKGGRGEVPAHVLLPRPIGRTGGNLPHGHTAGYLGKQYDPFILNADPNAPELQGARPAAAGLHLRACGPSAGRSSATRWMARPRRSRTTAQAKQLDDNFDLAYRLMSQPKAREAFALDKEPADDARPLRPDALRPVVPAGPPADRGAACAS